MATCIKDRKGYRLCVSQKCTEPAVICRSEDCECEDKHSNCKESIKIDISTADLNSKLIFRKEEALSKRFEEMVARVRNLPNALPQNLMEWKGEIGLSLNQARLLRELAKACKFGMDGRSVREIEMETAALSHQIAEELVVKHLRNIEDMVVSLQQAFKLLTKIRVDNVIGPEAIKNSPAYFSDQENHGKISQLTKILKQTEQRCAALEKQNQQSQLYMSVRTEAVREEHQNAIGALQQQIREMDIQNKMLKAEINDLTEAKKRQQQQTLEYMDEKQYLAQKVKEQTKIIDVLKRQLETMKHQFAQSMMGNRQVSARPQGSSDDRNLAKMQEIVAMNQNKITALVQEIQRLTKMLSQYKMKMETLMREINQLQRALSQSQMKNNESYKIISQFKCRCKQLEDRLQKSKAEIEKKGGGDDRQQAMKEEIQNLRKENSCLREELNSFKKKIIQQQRQSCQLMKQLEHSKYMITNKTKEQEQYRREIAMLRQQNIELCRQMTQTGMIISKLQAQNMELAERMQK